MLDNTNLRDCYSIILKRTIPDIEVYRGDKIEVSGNIAYISRTGEEIFEPVGEVTYCLGDVLDVEEEIHFLRENKIIAKETEKSIILNSADMEVFERKLGIVQYTRDQYIIVYHGVIEKPDGYNFISAKELNEHLVAQEEKQIEEDFLYGLTSLGEAIVSRMADKTEMVEEERKETTNMENLFSNLGFGKLRDPRFKLSINGIAVSQSNGKYVVYNKDSNEFVDASDLIFDVKDALFLLPSVDVKVGDTIIHENKPYFIVDTTNEIKAVDYETCTQTVLIPKSTMFGIKYFSKIFSMFGDNFAAAGDLFSNPMMLMALMDGGNTDITQLMLFNSMNNGDLGSNPMALAMMLKGDKGNDSLSTIALMSMFNNGTNPFAPKTHKNTNKTTKND